MVKLSIQRKKCKQCQYWSKPITQDDEWCYMFKEIFIGCRKFIPLATAQDNLPLQRQ